MRWAESLIRVSTYGTTVLHAGRLVIKPAGGCAVNRAAPGLAMLLRVASRRVAAGGTRQRPTLWRSSLRYDSAVVLGLESHRQTHCAPCGRFVQTNGGESEVEARFARRLKPCAPRRHRVGRCRAPPAAQASSGGVRNARHHGCSKGGLGQAGARLCGAEERKSHGRAQSAHPHLTWRSLSERRERSERSEFCARP